MNSEKSACRRKPIDKSTVNKASKHVEETDKKDEDNQTYESADLPPNAPTYNVTASCAEDTPNYLVYKKVIFEKSIFIDMFLVAKVLLIM